MHRPAFVLFIILLNAADLSAQTWPMHTIDDSSRGADGVRLADVDQDGRTDIATAWEEGGQIRVCFRPDSAVIKHPWPSIAVGNVKPPVSSSTESNFLISTTMATSMC